MKKPKKYFKKKRNLTIDFTFEHYHKKICSEIS